MNVWDKIKNIVTVPDDEYYDETAEDEELPGADRDAGYGFLLQ